MPTPARRSGRTRACSAGAHSRAVSDAQAPAARSATSGLAPAAGGASRWRPTCWPTASQRGVGYWPGDGTLCRACAVHGRQPRLFAVDAATGKPSAGFGTDGTVNVGVPYSGTPTIYRNVVDHRRQRQ